VLKKTAKQLQAVKVLSSKATHILLEGGSRSGKTAIIIFAIFVRACKAKSRHLIVRYKFNHAKRSLWLDTMPKVINLISPKLIKLCRPNKTDYYYRLWNGSEIWVSGLDSKDKSEKALGNEYSTVFFNECSQIPWFSIIIAITRLAEKNTLKKKAYYDQNPPKKSHWTYKVFHELKDPNDKRPLDPKDYVFFKMNPEDNKENIDESYMKLLDSLPSNQKKRFKSGEYQDDDSGDVFKTSKIKRVWSIDDIMFERIVVAIDPATTSNDSSDETAITATAKRGKFGYVLESIAGRWTPNEWATKAIEMYVRLKADRIIGEANNGGDMIEAVLRGINSSIPYSSVYATRNKVVRAEPTSAKYERDEVYHFGYMDELESEMDDFKTDWSRNTNKSPNRVDALVWGMTELFPIEEEQIIVAPPSIEKKTSRWTS